MPWVGLQVFCLEELGEELVSLSILKYSTNNVCSVGYMADNSHEEVLPRLQVYSSSPTSFLFLSKNLVLAFEEGLWFSLGSEPQEPAVAARVIEVRPWHYITR